MKMFLEYQDLNASKKLNKNDDLKLLVSTDNDDIILTIEKNIS
jgi:hypothetical protein